MTKVFEIVVYENGRQKIDHDQKPSLRVTSDEVIPAGLGKGSEAYIIDKVNAAVCDGRDNWYGKGGKSASAGQTWAELC